MLLYMFRHVEFIFREAITKEYKRVLPKYSGLVPPSI
jgi:hypothetical protein